MSFVRAIKIMTSTIPQLKKIARVRKTTPSKLRKQARTVIKEHKRERRAMGKNRLKDQSDFSRPKGSAGVDARRRKPDFKGASRLTKEIITGRKPKRR